MLDSVGPSSASSPPQRSAETEAHDLIAAHTRYGVVDSHALAQGVANAPGDRSALAADIARALPQADKGAFVGALTALAHPSSPTPAPPAPPQHSGGSVLGDLWGGIKDAGGYAWSQAKDAGGVIVGAGKDLGHLVIGVGGATADLTLGPAIDAAREAAGLVTGHTPAAPSWLPSGEHGVQTLEDAGKTLLTAATHPGAVWDGLKAPYVQDVAQGRWGALAAQTVVDFGGLLDGESEAVDLARGASVAEKVAETSGDVERGATAVEHASPLAEGAEAAGGLSRMTAKVGENQVTWAVNGEGRGLEADAVLRQTFDGADRSGSETKLTHEVGQSGGRTNDDGGHIIAHRFMLDQGEKNMFPQNANFNRGAYKTMENEWAAWTKAGGEVHVDVRLEDFDGARPAEVQVHYEVKDPATGNVIYAKSALFDNEAGQTFARQSQAQIAAMMQGR